MGAPPCGSKELFKSCSDIASPSPDGLAPYGLYFVQATPCFPALGVATADQRHSGPKDLALSIVAVGAAHLTNIPRILELFLG